MQTAEDFKFAKSIPDSYGNYDTHLGRERLSWDNSTSLLHFKETLYQGEGCIWLLNLLTYQNFSRLEVNQIFLPSRNPKVYETEILNNATHLLEDSGLGTGRICFCSH